MILYVDGEVNSKSITTYFIIEVYLVNNLKVNILFNNDTILI